MLLCCIVMMSSVSAKEFPLVLCNDLNRSQSHLRRLEIKAHTFPDALDEAQCVRVDACAQKNHRGESVPRNTWMWRNASALWLDGNDTAARTSARLTAYNWHSLEYARVPEGLHVRACEPDFNTLRLKHELVCAAGTEVSLDMRAGLQACPSLTPFTLLNCMQSLQHRPLYERLPFRAKNTRMAFGSETWYDACLAANVSEVALTLCKLLETSYEVNIPLATTTSRVQMVWYDFSEGYGCFGSTDTHAGTRLSRFELPNRVVTCAEVAHGTLVASSDATQCEFACDQGYTKSASECVLGCTESGATLTHTFCSTGQYATKQCVGGGVTYYQCTACGVVPGSSVHAWSTDTPGVCAYEACQAGTYGDANTCKSCPVHHYAPNSNMTACLDCAPHVTGRFQPLMGQTECTACFAEAPATACAPGQALVTEFAAIKSYFERVQLSENENMTAYCESGRACLPCEPGTAELNATCIDCPRGHYQPNFQATTCFACSHGQTTNRTKAVAMVECVCKMGFE